MCEPRISPAKTDAELASKMRLHLSSMTACAKELHERGYSVTYRSPSGYVTSTITTIEIEKVVKL